MLHPAREAEVVLETSVAVMEVSSVGMTTLVVEEKSVVEVALDMLAVGMVMMDLVMMEAILEVAEATMILAITAISLPVLDPWEEGTLEAEVLAPTVVKANTLSNHETKVAMVVPAAAVAMAVAEGFNYCPETKLSRRGGSEK